MTVEAQVYAALQGLAEGRVFPDFAEAGTETPYITYQAVGGEPINFLTGETPNKTKTRIQVNVWSKSRIEASELGQQVEDALRETAALQTEVATGRVATFDETTKYRGTMQDFSIFY